MGYREQWERVERLYDRFKKINDGMENVGSSLDLQDDIYSFFVHCYHVKDYLKNDPSYRNHTNSQIEQYISTTGPLMLCADICNGIKHFQLRGSRSGSPVEFGRRTFTMGLEHNLSGENPPTTFAMKLEVSQGQTSFDAFELATRCMDAWRIFM